MSPEQANFNNLDIDTRSDVYALGVLLYELLAGSPPFRKKEMEKIGLLEIFRVIREEEPPRPSEKLSTAEGLPSLAANRGTEPKKLTGILRNELDWIVMKALEKDRTRRYETANGFAADVNRYLAGEAVQAHPPSTTYRIKKFVRRNKVQVIAASWVLFALLAGIAGTTIGLVRADEKRREAQQAREAETEQRAEVQIQRAKIADERDAAVKDNTLTRQALNSMTANVVPIVTLNKERDLTKIYLKVLELEEANVRRGLAIWERLVHDLPDSLEYHHDLARSHSRLGYLLRALNKTAEAEREYLDTAQILTRLTGEDPLNSKYRNDLAVCWLNVGSIHHGLWSPSSTQRALEQYMKAAALWEVLARENPSEPAYLEQLAHCHNGQGQLLNGARLDEAKDHYLQVRDISRRLAERHPAVTAYQIEPCGSFFEFGHRLRDHGRPTESLTWFDSAIQILTPFHAANPKDPQIRMRLRNSLSGRAESYDLLERFDEAARDWNLSVELTNPAGLSWYRVKRTLASFRAGKGGEFVDDLATFVSKADWDGRSCWDLACLYALAAIRFEDKRKEYADRAMKFLKQAVQAGSVENDWLRQDRSLDALRDRDEFNQLLADLDKKVPPRRKQIPAPRVVK